MERDNEVSNAAFEYIKSDAVKAGEEYISFGDFIEGAKWADAHPHWISVEEELPPIGGIVLVVIPLGGELSVLPLSIKNESDFKYLSGMTHWMPLPQPPKEGGDQ